ncbi:DUF3973 domain-containing protein [Paenibacillus puerhi]|uniref:DUF3973 domain-containing protein n=1 Tax=Paenibacillus puerhi TaxID=2692622 RepID=UPI001357E9B1|nr:DUF3973 domain-containing protein [Paenibacillus puerhi]
MYYCLCCQRLHPADYSSVETIYSSGFRYIDQVLYNAGVCSPLTELPAVDWMDEQEQIATRSA